MLTLLNTLKYGGITIVAKISTNTSNLGVLKTGRNSKKQLGNQGVSFSMIRLPKLLTRSMAHRTS